MSQYQDHYKRSIENPEEFWMEQAGKIDWFTPPNQALSNTQKISYSKALIFGILLTPAFYVH